MIFALKPGKIHVDRDPYPDSPRSSEGKSIDSNQLDSGTSAC